LSFPQLRRSSSRLPDPERTAGAKLRSGVEAYAAIHQYLHYQLATTGDETHARKLVQQLRQAALDLPFQHVGDIVNQSRMFKGTMGQAPRAGTVEARIATYPNFEHLEAEGQRLLPEQLKTMLKALARSKLLRGDVH